MEWLPHASGVRGTCSTKHSSKQDITTGKRGNAISTAEKTALTIIEGGKAPASRRRQPVPAALQPLFTQLRKHHRVISQAYQPLREKQEDLETDWATREAEFWQETLTALQALKAAMQQACALVGDLNKGTSTAFIGLRYDLMIPLYSALRLIDEAGIETTSYLAVCTSTKVGHLQQRHELLKKLQELSKEVLTVLDITGATGQQKCSEEYERTQREWAAWRAREEATQATDQSKQDQ